MFKEKKIKGNLISTKKGSILAYALLTVSLMIAIVSSISVATILESKSAGSSQFSSQALQMADSGAQLAVSKMKAKYNKDITTVFGSCTVDANGKAVVRDLTDANPGATNASYSLYFIDASGVDIGSCSTIVTQVDQIKSVAKFRNSARAIQVKIPCLDPCCRQTQFTDVRGSESITYPIVGIGSKCWFAENLRTQINPKTLAALTRYCYSNTAANCNSPWGGLYDWNTATGGVAATKIGDFVQGICPNGWHIPGDFGGSATDEMGLLASAVNSGSGNGDIQLKLPSTTYWALITGYTNSTGFSAVGSGYYNGTSYVNRTNYGYFWSSAVSGANPIVRIMWYSNTSDFFYKTYTSYLKTYYMPVRCVKN